MHVCCTQEGHPPACQHTDKLQRTGAHSDRLALSSYSGMDAASAQSSYRSLPLKFAVSCDSTDRRHPSLELSCRHTCSFSAVQKGYLVHTDHLQPASFLLPAPTFSDCHCH